MSDLTEDEQWNRDWEPLDYSPSSGSVGNNTYPHGPTEHDGRAKTHTTFRPDEAGPDSRNWGHMNKLQSGQYADDLDMRRNHADQRRDLTVAFTQLPLTKWEKHYAEHLLAHCHRTERENDTSGSFYNRGETLVLAVVTFAANKNERRIRRYDEFAELRESFGVSPREIRSERKCIRENM